MAASARRVFSLKGFMSETIHATDIKSRADARKKGPFVGESGELLLWAKGIWKDRKQLRRPCFRHYPTAEGGSRELRRTLDDESRLRNSQRGEGSLHRTAKTALAEHLREMVAKKSPLWWHFKDNEASDFNFSGNLLADVEVIEEEYTIKLPLEIEYRADVALLGPTVHSKRVLLGIIELESGNEAELTKCLLCKTTGAPVLLVNLRETETAQIDKTWCGECITQTTETTLDGRRVRNYILLHTMLYPVFSDAPREMFPSEHHQFLIFMSDALHPRFQKLLTLLKTDLGLSDKEVSLSPVRLNPTNKGSVTMFENEGRLAGNLWREYNKNQFLRLAVCRPIAKQGPLFQFHLLLTTLLTAHFDALVGYKYGTSAPDFRPSDPLWIWSRWDIQAGRAITHRLLPKHVSEPIRKIVDLIEARH